LKSSLLQDAQQRAQRDVVAGLASSTFNAGSDYSVVVARPHRRAPASVVAPLVGVTHIHLQTRGHAECLGFRVRSGESEQKLQTL
jgi:hypothetical protein